ncbi:hypothetical protein GA0115280_112042 [Streptomyces sp. Cmuel-A718b]|nr:hypothetical protein GA0115280_112042 [Streptomyces sp. Cmuel-A718b]
MAGAARAPAGAGAAVGAGRRVPLLPPPALLRHAVVRTVLPAGGARCAAALGGDDELARVVVAGLVGPTAARGLAPGVAGRGGRAELAERGTGLRDADGLHGHVVAHLGPAPGPLRQLPHGREVVLRGARHLGERHDGAARGEQPPVEIPLPGRLAVTRAVGHGVDVQTAAVDESAQLAGELPDLRVELFGQCLPTRHGVSLPPSCPPDVLAVPRCDRCSGPHIFRSVRRRSVPDRRVDYPRGCAKPGCQFLPRGRTGAFGTGYASSRASNTAPVLARPLLCLLRAARCAVTVCHRCAAITPCRNGHFRATGHSERLFPSFMSMTLDSGRGQGRPSRRIPGLLAR